MLPADDGVAAKNIELPTFSLTKFNLHSLRVGVFAALSLGYTGRSKIVF